MGKKMKEFKTGDFIFAKVKGYPAWPARVKGVKGKKYFVHFYGTGETANLAANVLFDYAENKDKFLTKSIKRKDFNEGLEQIERAISNGAPLPAEETIEADENDVSMADVSQATENEADDSLAETTGDGETEAADSTANDSTVSSQNDTTVADEEESNRLVIDEGKKSSRRSTKAEQTPTKAAEPKTPTPQPAEEENTELISRSGRKIRPKRFVDESTEENATLPSPVTKKVKTSSSPNASESKARKTSEVDTSPDVGAKAASENVKHYNAVHQSDIENMKEPFNDGASESEGGTVKENILIARLPDARYVGIKLFQGRPATFKSESARLNWDNSMAKNAIKLKIQLESSQITPESIQNQLEMDLNLSEEEKSNLDKEWEVEEKKSRIQFFQIEMKLSDLTSKIRSCLGWEKADTEQCIKLLDELVELEIQPLMLLKNAALVETIKRMRQYVGNPTTWKLDEEEALHFSKQAHLIRKKSEHCYNMFKILFNVPEGLSFWEAFTEQVMQFKECTEHLSSDELCEIVTEPPGMKSEPRAFTMQSAIDAAIKDGALSSEEESSKKDKKKDSKEKIKPSAKRSKLSTSTDGSKKEPLKRTLSKASTGSKPEEASPDASNGALNGEGEPVESSEVKEKSDAKKAKIVTKKTEAASVKSPSKRKSK